MSNKQLHEIVSKNIMKYLEINGKTQTEVAKVIGVSPTTFNSWCTGNAIPRAGALQSLADYFGIQKSDILKDEDEETPSYYLDNETREMAQLLKENNEMKMLFDAARNVSADDLKLVHDMLLRMSKIEKHED